MHPNTQIELIEEEEAFRNYREQHAERKFTLNNGQKGPRYSATLQRTSAGLCGRNMSPTLSGERVSGEGGTRENERLRGIKNNFSRLVSCIAILTTISVMKIHISVIVINL